MKQQNSISSLLLMSIRIDHGIQQRARMLDAGIVAEYAEAMKSASKFPPVMVYYDGANYWLSDGYHRVEAADEAGLKTIAAEVREGTQRDATLNACGANRDHGLHRPREDVLRATTTLVMAVEWNLWTNRATADRVGCSAKTAEAVSNAASRCVIAATAVTNPDPRQKREATVYCHRAANLVLAQEGEMPSPLPIVALMQSWVDPRSEIGSRITALQITGQGQEARP